MARKPHIYMDSCCFIDMVKSDLGKALTDERVNDAWFCRRLLEANQAGDVVVFASVLSVAECQYANADSGEHVQDLFDRLLMSGQYITLVQPTPFIAIQARNLRWKHGISLRGADALHIASALNVGCKEFITTDERIKKQRVKLGQLGIAITNGGRTALLPAEYRQVTMPAEAKQEVPSDLQPPSAT